MQLQQFNPNTISITQLRRDIDVLENVLANNDEAVVVRNQDVLFVAVSPKKYQEIKNNYPGEKRDLAVVVKNIDMFRKTVGSRIKGNAGSDYIIKMRDEQVNKWKK